MKRRTSLRLEAILAAALVMLFACACSLNTPSVDAALQKQATSPAVSTPAIKTAGTLTVGLRNTSVTAPFESVATSGEATGMDVDVASALADQLGLSVKFVSVTDAKSALAGTCDIVMNVKSGESGDVTVVGSYAETAAALFHKGATASVTTSDVNGKTVGLQSSSVSQRTLARTNLSVTQKEFTNLNGAFAALDEGSVDYVLCDAYAGGYLATTYDDMGFCGSLDAPTPLGVGVATSNATLQGSVKTALDTISSNGVLASIHQRWVGDLPTLGASNQVTGITLTEASTGSNAASSTDATSATTNAGNGTTAGSNAVTL
ncbi:MAG: transporter substrate-binding domain-containing protein [Atopobiaceae bacterium]|jgi:polar amino acid transport system substrate-binding protein|nr:transporter substrate-binding domain-containing protein [Atopobiaceae bacterium]